MHIVQTPGIWFVLTWRHRKKGFVVESAGTVGISCQNTHPILEHVIIRENGTYGIHCGNEVDITVKNCWIHNNGSAGVYLSNIAEGGYFRNCTIAANVGLGIINYSGATSVSVENAIFWQNKKCSLLKIR